MGYSILDKRLATSQLYCHLVGIIAFCWQWLQLHLSLIIILLSIFYSGRCEKIAEIEKYAKVSQALARLTC